MATKPEFINFMRRHCNISKDMATGALDIVTRSIAEYLSMGETVVLQNYGKFHMRKVRNGSVYHMVFTPFPHLRNQMDRRLKAFRNEPMIDGDVDIDEMFGDDALGD